MDNTKNTQGIWDRELTYEETHLPVTKEIIMEFLVRDVINYLDMEAIYWSTINTQDYDLQKWIPWIAAKQATLIDKP